VVLAGGKAPTASELAKGCYFEPTVVKPRTTRTAWRRKEVFGPFVTVITFKDDEEALTIANGTDYGLGSGLWTTNLQRAHRVARDIHAGMVWINSYKRVNPARHSAASGRAVMAGRWVSRRCASTPTSRACGSTSMRKSRRGT